LEHLEENELIIGLSEIRRVLKGKFIVMVPYNEDLQKLTDRLKKNLRKIILQNLELTTE